MSDTIVIEKGVPMPQRNTTHNYPFAEMEIGDSFVVPKSRKAGLAQAARTYSTKVDSKVKFTLRTSKTVDEVRMWRVV